MYSLPPVVIDAHHHLWDLGEVSYPWLMAKGVRRFFGDPSPIQKNYYPKDLCIDAAPIKLSGSVHIQVGAAIADSFKETQWLQSQADQSKEKLPSAIVAFADLCRGDIEDVLSLQFESPNVRGVRQIVGRHPTEDAASGTDTLIEDPRWRMGLRVLESTGASFDLQLVAGQYLRMVRMLETVPNLPVAICHFASPWQQDAWAYRDWCSAMKRFSQLPKVVMKFSGFAMFDQDWTIASIRPYVEASLEMFGPARCMVGSNYPVDGLRRKYGDIFHAVNEIMLTDGASREDRALVFAGSAKSFYRI